MRIGDLKPKAFRRYVLAPILLVLQIGVAIAAPLSHAYAETQTADRAVETTHSKHCAVIHSDAQCGVSIFKYQYAAAKVQVAIAPVIRITAHSDILARRPERVRRLRANGERAPPSR